MKRKPDWAERKVARLRNAPGYEADQLWPDDVVKLLRKRDAQIKRWMRELYNRAYYDYTQWSTEQYSAYRAALNDLAKKMKGRP